MIRTLLSLAILSLATTTFAQQRDITLALPNGATMDMVWIEAGSFMMGSPAGDALANKDEYPQHEVIISRGFHMGKFEVTQEQWETVMGEDPWNWDKRTYVKAQSDMPAVYISWNDCQRFCAALNEFEGRAIYRLPTESEWEYACRAGTTTTWYYGDSAVPHPEHAWYVQNTFFSGEPWGHVVGSKTPNPWGLYDMYGNAWEWVFDWYYGVYPTGPVIDPQGPADDKVYRVTRGGIFMQPPTKQRSAARFGGAPDFPDGGVGMRLVRQEPTDTAIEAQSWGQIKTESR